MTTRVPARTVWSPCYDRAGSGAEHLQYPRRRTGQFGNLIANGVAHRVTHCCQGRNDAGLANATPTPAVFPARTFARMSAWYTRQHAGLRSSSGLPRPAFFRGVIAPLIAAAPGAAPEQKSVRHLAVAAVHVHQAHNCRGSCTGRRRGWGFGHVFVHSVSSTVPP